MGNRESEPTKRPLRILQFVEGGGRYGAAVSLVNLAEALRARGHDVSIAVFQGRPLGDDMRARGFDVIDIQAEHRYDWKGVRDLKRVLREGRFDLLHTHLSKATINGSIAARIAHVPVVATVHGMNKKWTYMLPNHVIAVSEAGRQHLLKQGMKPDRVTTAYNGLFLDSISLRSRGDARAALGLPEGVQLLGTVARAHFQKGIGDAIKALHQIRDRFPNAAYVLAGEGKHFEELQECAAKEGLADAVFFLGYVEDVYLALAAMDIFVFPTLQEAFGISLVEAMAARLPIITTSVGGIREVVDETTAVFVPTEDPAAIAAAALRLLDDPAEAAALGERARARAEEKFSMIVSVAAVEAVYGKLLRSV